MLNTINTYGYMVVRNINGIPLHIVEIKHYMLSNFAVFSNANDAKNYILEEKEHLKEYAMLNYDNDFIFTKSLVDLFRNEKYYLFTALWNKQIYISKNLQKRTKG